MSSDDVTVEMGRLALHGLVVGAARYYMGRSTVSAVRMAHDLARLARSWELASGGPLQGRCAPGCAAIPSPRRRTDAASRGASC